ncbi:MAG: outer membrane protein assembly factor BamB family protein [Planctomycetota bacterium]|jgi:outer membrane protein assembly factor BamB
MVLDSEFTDVAMLLLDDKNKILRRYEVIMRKYCMFLMFVLVGVSVACAGDWPHWRGPYFNGSTDEKNLPSTWSTSDNIAWSVDLAGSSAATPIIWGDRVFLSGVDSARDMLLAMCFDRVSGELLWQHDIAKGISRDNRSTYAASSPVTDGKIVVFFYANGDLVSYDINGNRQWARNLHDDYGEFAFQWTFASSPTLFDGRLYVQVLQRDVPARGHGLKDRMNESYILAMNPATGKDLWRQIRPSKAVAESREAFTTPIPYSFNGKKQLLVVGGDALTGHDLKTGKELWRWGTWNPRRIRHWRLVPSPVVGEDIILVCAPKNDPIYAIRPRGTGVYDDSAIAWVSRDVREISSDVPTPAFFDGDFFVLSDLQKCLSRVELRTGKVKWTIRTPGDAKYEASPLVADGKVYIINHAGEAAVIDAANGDIHKVIPMDKPSSGEVVRASISAAHGQLFIRTRRRLYCVGKGG